MTGLEPAITEVIPDFDNPNYRPTNYSNFKVAIPEGIEPSSPVRQTGILTTGPWDHNRTDVKCKVMVLLHCDNPLYLTRSQKKVV